MVLVTAIHNSRFRKHGIDVHNLNQLNVEELNSMASVQRNKRTIRFFSQ